MAASAKPDTILAWYRRLIARKFDVVPVIAAFLAVPASKLRWKRWSFASLSTAGVGVMTVLAGALANLGHVLSDQTVGNILRRYGIAPAPNRSRTTTWKEFIRRHMDVLVGTDFFTVEVLSWRGLVPYYVLFFIELESRRVWIGGITQHPDASWMQQVARNATLEGTRLSGTGAGTYYMIETRSFAASSGRRSQVTV